MSIIITEDQREAVEAFFAHSDWDWSLCKTQRISVLDVLITWFQAKKTARIDVNDKFTFCNLVHVYGTLS